MLVEKEKIFRQDYPQVRPQGRSPFRGEARTLRVQGRVRGQTRRGGKFLCFSACSAGYTLFGWGVFRVFSDPPLLSWSDWDFSPAVAFREFPC